VSADKVIVSGYLVRCPLGGYAWQILHYLLGLRELGFDPYFYEDNRHFWDCYDPSRGGITDDPGSGVAFVTRFFGGYGLERNWGFFDAARDRSYGLSSAERTALINDARLVINLAGVNRWPTRVPGQRHIFIDLDPGYTQIKAASGDRALLELLAEADVHFTLGENIGRPDCRVPTAGIEWRPTRQPVVVDLWSPQPASATAAYTTIGKWDDQGRDVRFEGETYAWRKRVEWMKFIELPQRTGERFEVAMHVQANRDDFDRMQRHGWRMCDPIAVSADADVYRQFIQQSKGEFTVAKDLNVRLATGWFSDRGACYLAAGRPVVTQDTGFDRVLPTGKGLFSYRTVDEAAAAFESIRVDYAGAARAAREIALTYFRADVVLRELLNV